MDPDRSYSSRSWFCNGKDISEMMHRTIRGHLDCPEPNAVLNIETHLFNTILTADSCRYNLDVGKHVWLNVGRWSRLIREYVPRDSLDRFVGNAVEILTGQARDGATCNFMFHDPARASRKHRWGGCLMGATFRGDNRRAGRATLTFYSRTTYIAYMGLLDAGIAALMAREIARAATGVGKKPQPYTWNDISFRWHLSSQQLHSFKSLPYIYSQPDLMAKLERYARNPKLLAKAPPSWFHIAKWYGKIVKGWDDYREIHHPLSEGVPSREDVVQSWLLQEKYGPFRRVKRRWAEHKKLLTKWPPPSLPIKTLNFEKSI